MICIVYSRVSTEDQAKHGYSLPDQREQGEAKAKALGYAEGQIVHLADEGISGEVLERPGLIRARELIRAGGVGHLICKDPDRLSRKLAHLLLIRDEFDARGVGLEYLTYDRQQSMDGILLENIRGVIAEFEKAKIRERTMSGRLAKAKRGGIPQFTRCYGYAYDKEADTLSLDPTEAPMVAQIYAWFLAGWTYYKISEELNGTGIRAARGGTWTPRVIMRLLSRPIYKGDYIVRRYNTEGVNVSRHKAPADRIRARERPASEHIHIPAPAIVDEITWERAQAEIRRRREFRPGHPKLDYPLSGLCRCAYCGAHLRGMGKRWINYGKRGQAWAGAGRYYVCSNKGGRGGRNCTLNYRRADALEAEVWEYVKAWMKDPAAFAEAIRGESEQEDPGQYAAVEKQARELAEERGRLVELYVQGLIPKPEKRLEEMKAREEFLARRLADLKPRPAVVIDEEMLAAEFAEFAAELDDATPEERRRACRTLIDWVDVWNDRIKPHPKHDMASTALPVNGPY